MMMIKWSSFLYGLLLYVIVTSLYIIHYKPEYIKLLLLQQQQSSSSSSYGYGHDDPDNVVGGAAGTSASAADDGEFGIYPHDQQRQQQQQQSQLSLTSSSSSASMAAESKVPRSSSAAAEGAAAGTTTETTTSSIQKANYTLYKCGYGRPRLRKYLFPEIIVQENKDDDSVVPYKRTSKPNVNDILLFGMHGKCDGTLNNKITPNYVEQHFPGKALFVNGEPFGNILTDVDNGSNGGKELQHVYQAGPPISCNPSRNNNNNNENNDDGTISHITNHSHMICLYHVAVILITMIPTYQIEWIFNHSLKPKNDLSYDAVMYMASNCVPFRQDAAKQISQYIPIHFGGSCTIKKSTTKNTNTNDTTITTTTSTTTTTTTTKSMRHVTGRREKRHDNYKIFSKYKYCLVMENSNVPGYISEKILFGYLGGCVPIYYGTKEIFDVFNPKSFIYYDIHQPQLAIQQLQYLQRNHTAYMDMLYHEPILANGQQTINEYFSLSDTIGNGQLKRKIRTLLGLPP